MRKPKNDRKWILRKMGILMLFFLVASLAFMIGFKRQIEPNIDAVSQLKAKGIVNEIINETIKSDFAGKDYEENLFRIEKGNDGKIQMVQPNTRLINQLVSSFGAHLQKKYDQIEPREVNLSYGTIMGSKILSQTNLSCSIKILPLSVHKSDFETEFETQGINQTKYKIYIIIESSIRVLQPFSANDFKLKSKMLIAEVVIIGEVPDSFVQVPKEDILDVTPE